MASPLLATKLYLPPLRPNRVARPALVERLNQGLQPGVRLTLVSAPPGFGKTTVALEWARASQLPVAWLSLDEGDNDPVRFWHYVIAALQTVDPEMGREMSAALDAPTLPAFEAALALLINDLTGRQADVLLVLDDYHLIQDHQIHESLAFLIDHAPPHFHLALLTRADPPLQLARRRARASMVELRAVDLRFSETEAEDFFQRAMRLALSAQEVAALEERTEGWVAGLQMAAVAMQGQPGDWGSFVAAFTGDDRYIADYLVEEVLERQSPAVQNFLLRTSILERFCAGLCEALLDEGEKPLDSPDAEENSASHILEYLDRANLFLSPLDNRREWFRYHHLFAQLLQQRARQTLGTAGMHALYQRAAEWHLAHEEPGEAVDYALASEDMNLAAGMMMQSVTLMFMRGELTALQRWAERLPQAQLSQNPNLSVPLAWAANATGHDHTCETLIQLVEGSTGLTVDAFLALDEPARRNLPAQQLGTLVELAVLRARLILDGGNTREILDRYRVVLPFLVEERNVEPYIFNMPMALRGPMVFIIARAQEMLGQVEDAMQGFEEAADLAEKIFNIHIIAVALGHLGQLQLALGRLREADATFQRAAAFVARHGEGVSAFFGISFVGMGNLAYERNDLETARRELAHGLRLGKLWNNWEALLPGSIGQMRLALAEGDLAGAEEAGARLDALARSVPSVIGPIAEAWRAYLSLTRGKIHEAQSWAQAAAAHLPGPATVMHAEQALILARIWLAQGQAEQAAKLLAAQSAAADAAGQCSGWLRLEVCRAVALDAAGKRVEALDVLERLLADAEREGYTRSFLDEGEALARLLRARLERGDAPPAVIRLLAAFPVETADSGAGTPGMAEILSPRELEILGLLAGEASNAEIAGRCYITVNTLKKHISSIYGKLGVSNRHQAIQRARQLKLM